MRVLITFIMLALATSSFGQMQGPVFMKWKIPARDSLVYKTAMEEIDPDDFGGLFMDIGTLFDLLQDSSGQETNELKKVFFQMNESLKDNDLITTMSPDKKGYINIIMKQKAPAAIPGTKKDSAAAKSGRDMKSMFSDDIQLRGAVSENGAIQSFYVRNDQKNLISLFFQLPNKPVQPGDSWPLDVNLISVDQNFTCDTAFKKNNVTLLSLKKSGDDTIAVLKYDILEFVSGDFKTPFTRADEKTVMKLSYYALAEFSLMKGRWVSYDGIMSLKAEGFMSRDMTKKFRLIEQ